MKGNSLSVKLTSALLAFLFIIAPISSVLAQEAAGDSAPSAEVTSTPASTEIPASTDPTGTVNVDAGKTKNDPLTPNDLGLDASKDKKTKDKDGKDGTDLQTMTATSNSSTSGSSSNSSSSQKQIILNPNDINGPLTYDYPIVVPPGRNGLEPDLKLSYNSQLSVEESVFGYGWNINIPYIERINRKGTDKLYTENYFNSSLSGELVSLGGSSYGSKVDNGEFLKYEFNGTYWLVTDKQGTKYKFGYSAATRQDNPNDSTKVFKWMLEEVRDTNDTYIKYEYFKDNGQIYPSRIVYTGSGATDGIFEVEFLREAISGVLKSYKTGFAVTTGYRINEIRTKVNGNWVKKYILGYQTANTNTHSLLNSVTESGQDELNNVISLPATSFSYQTINRNWTLDTSWTIPVFLDDIETHIADANGDSLPDILVSRPSTNSVYINNGHGWTQDTSWVIPIYLDNGPGRIEDVNGDSLPDILMSRTNGNSIYINNGHGWSLDTSWVIPVYLDTTESHIADVNGDSLPDILVYMSYSTKVYINNGHGWTLDTSWVVPVYLDSSESHLLDINGDSLTDILISTPSTNSVYLNNGHGWTQDTSWVIPVYLENTTSFTSDVNGDALADIMVSRTTYINNGHGWVVDPLWQVPTYLQSMGTYIPDVNGDGLSDILETYQGTYPIKKVYLNNGPKSDLLTRINYSTGGKTDITYKATPLYITGSNLSNPNLPFIIDTVQAVNTSDGFGNTSTTTYSYEGGKYYYNSAFDRKFAGFSKVTRTDSVGNITKTYFHQGDSTNSSQGEFSDHSSKIGKLYRTEIYNSTGNLHSKSINKWENYDLGNGRNFVKLTQKIDSSYDGNATHKDKAETYAYDNANGNLTGKIQWGEVTGSDNGTFTDVGSDKLTESITYASNITLNVLGLPSSSTLTNQSATKIKESRYYYDNLALGSVDKGNLTKEENWKSGTNYINAQKTYNSYGLVTQTTDPRGKITTYAYDSYNLYPATVTNPLNQATQYTYDYSSGKVKQTTDPNGFIFQMVYDGLDRVIGEKQPDLTTPATLVTKSAYVYTDTSNAVSVKKTDYLDATTSVDSYSYLDGLGRIIQTRKEAEVANNFSVKDFVYNNRGLLNKESLPYFSSGSARTASTAVTGLYSVYAYDPLERITSTANAVGTITNAYDDWKVTTTDAKGNQKDLYKDAYGNLIKVGEHNGANIYTTIYTYDGAGNLTKITDALGNVRNFTYDGLGRRLTAQDLHASADTTFGTWTYTYDASGNLTSRLDPKGQTVNYTYDNINRLLTEDYTGWAGTEVTYTYDTCVNGKGRLCSVATNDYTESKKYNALGLISDETKSIDSVSYPTSYIYDRQGNITSFTNPDGSMLKYSYNTAGQLEQVQGKEAADTELSNVVTDFDYSPLGNITYQAFQNGSSTTNIYDSTKLYRLSSKVTTITGGSHIQDLAYTYDANGNIIKIIDNSSTHSKKTTNYAYDPLNRLLSATATGAVNGQNYTETYAYNAIGNITSKNGVAYTYSQTGKANPHAVTSIGSANYTYDDNGNLLTDGTLTNTWNYDNRLTQSVIGSMTVSYIYDVSGQRIGYSNGTDTTYYPTKDYNITGEVPTKQIFARDQLVATVKGTAAAAEIYFVHTDHLTGSNVITNGPGALEELMDYYPYGDIRLDEKAGTFSEQRKFGGHEYDGDTGLNYAGSRYYDASIGRFISQDPAYLAVGDNSKLKALTKLEIERYLADPQLANSYSYVSNNPLKYTDSTGDFLDIALDVGFIGYDLYRMGSAAWNGNWNEVKSESANLGLDIGGAALPGITGLGMIRRAGEAAKLADKAADAGKVLNKAGDITHVDPNKIRFTQDSISRIFGNGNTLESTINGLKSGKISPDNFSPIRIFERNGKVYSLDNRRLEVFQKAGMDIPTVRATPQEIKNESWKIHPINDGKTIKVRGNN